MLDRSPAARGNQGGEVAVDADAIADVSRARKELFLGST
jgi:hypothetical protein